jgi:hypothetical protein
MGSRLGTALILLGLICLVIFLVTFSIQQSDVMILLLGASLSTLGLLVRRRSPKVRSTRFQTLRKLMGEEEEDPDPFS